MNVAASTMHLKNLSTICVERQSGWTCEQPDPAHQADQQYGNLFHNFHSNAPVGYLLSCLIMAKG
jgi:hypothetical protein